jgi:hypothetical protein
LHVIFWIFGGFGNFGNFGIFINEVLRLEFLHDLRGGVRFKFIRIASLFTKNCLSCAIGKSSASGSQDVHVREDESQTPTASKAGKVTLLESL